MHCLLMVCPSPFPATDVFNIPVPFLQLMFSTDCQVFFLPSGIWKPEKKMVFSLDDDLLYSVNRCDAIHQLQEIHKANFNRAVHYGSGRNWKIPICDNILGTGKTHLGIFYIEHCRSEWRDESSRTPFQAELCKCHTVHIRFRQEAFGNGTHAVDAVMSMEAVMLRYLKKSIAPLLKTKPKCLETSYMSTTDFLADFTAEAAPIFIVLDEIGVAFLISGLNDREQRDLFMRFCEVVLAGWLELPSVFFLVLGRGSFLNYVGRRRGYPDEGPQMRESRFLFERLAIQLLRKEAIEEILKYTYTDSRQQKTLMEYFDLDRPDVSRAANRLFTQTNGHPRTLLDALVQCRTKDDLLTFTQPLRLVNFGSMCQDLSRNHDTILKLLEKLERGEKVNLLTTVWEGKKARSLDVICNNALIAWAGSKQAATLFAPPCVVAFLTNVCQPFQKFIQLLNRQREIPLDFSNVFELMLVKRFQELFSVHRCPRIVLPSFFNTPFFGEIKDLLLPQKVYFLPIITLLGDRRPTLNSLTAHPSSWHFLMKEIDNLRGRCYKPRSMSSSPDAVFRVCDWNRHITVALAAKNYGQKTSFGSASLSRECVLFNQMFTRAGRAVRLNILIVCSTNYNLEMKQRFGGAKFFAFSDPKFKNIQEIIVLDLSSELNLAEFFGVSSEDTKNTIQYILQKNLVALPDADD
jgi:hypothetical protein